MTIKKENLITREISEALSNKRLDIVLAETFPEYSRSRLKKWLENNLVSVNQRIINKPSHKIIFPAKLELSVPNENLTEDLPEQYPNLKICAPYLSVEHFSLLDLMN